MKMLKHLFSMFLVIAVFSITTIDLNAQNYKTGIGARVGYPFGFTVKHNFSDKHAFEGIAASHDGRGFELIALYEYQMYPTRREEFDLYFGGGVHIGYYQSGRRYYWENGNNSYNSNFGVGIDGVVGVSWTFTGAPVNVGFDYKPSIILLSRGGFSYGNGAFSVRYTFK